MYILETVQTMQIHHWILPPNRSQWLVSWHLQMIKTIQFTKLFQHWPNKFFKMVADDNNNSNTTNICVEFMEWCQCRYIQNRNGSESLKKYMTQATYFQYFCITTTKTCFLVTGENQWTELCQTNNSSFPKY